MNIAALAKERQLNGLHQKLLSDLKTIAEKHDKTQFALSLGAEDMLLLDCIAKEQLPITPFILDTGRLHSQSYSFLERITGHYGVTINTLFPQSGNIEDIYNKYGPNGFYNSVEARKACCHVRKIEPLQRALTGADAWITGQRREQSMARSQLAEHEYDVTHQMDKYNPLALWGKDQLWSIIARRKVMTHPLHKQGMPSIGCEPCTRGIDPGEDERAGRWWWERESTKECGLHRT